MTSEQLRDKLRAPAVPRESVAPRLWPSIEKMLKTQLPADYKDFLRHFGTGCVNDFLWVLNPVCKNDNLNLFHKGVAINEALTDLRRQGLLGEETSVYPEEGGLLPWGVTDNGDVLCWRTAGDPEEWRTTVHDGASRFEHHDLSFSGLVVGLITGSVSSWLSVNMNDPEPTFVPWLGPATRRRVPAAMKRATTTKKPPKGKSGGRRGPSRNA